MPEREDKNACKDCMWYEICGRGRPCHYYTPYNYERRILLQETQRNKKRFEAEWLEYIEYWDDDATSF